MASPAVDIGSLSDAQQLALGTYTAVTNQDPSEAIPLLRRSEWNVQIAIAKFFDGETADPVAEAQAALASSPVPHSRQSSNLIDELSQPSTRRNVRRGDPAPRIVPQPYNQKGWRPPALIAILLSPFNLLTRVVGSSLSLLGYIISMVPRLFGGRPAGRLGAGSRAGRKNLPPTDLAARFAREFEEEYGPHNLRFYDRGYAQAYDLAKKDLKFLLVMLISPENDDNSAFIRTTLLAPEVVEFINDPQNKIILWAGSVQDSEAYQVSTGLNCSKFPFAGLVVHTPQDSSTAMSTVARVVGMQSPADFISKLRSAITQHSLALDQVRSTRNEQQAARNLREEQNSAYERSLAQDRERARLKREAEAASRRAEQEAKAQAAVEEEKALQLQQWRQWRAQSISPEPSPDAKDVTRISVRLSSGDRAVRKFAADAHMEELYAFAECYELLRESPRTTHTEKPEGYEHEYQFRLVSPLPRAIFDVKASGTVGEKIGRSGNLLVEAIDEDEV